MQFRRAKADDFEGLGRRGEVTADYGDLVRIFGEPEGQSQDNKSDAQWFLVFEAPETLGGGVKASIYNYKTGRAWRGPSAPATETLTQWHIGGGLGAVARVKEALRANKPKLNPSDPNGLWPLEVK